MAMTIVEGDRPRITGGVDTHRDVHVVAALNDIGGVLGVESFPVTRAGYAQLVGWLGGFGWVQVVGVEGTGSYGAGLARHLRGAGIAVIEVDCPDRQARHRHGKSDPVDAVAAARAVQSGRAAGLAKHRDGPVEQIRVLLVARRSAKLHRVQVLNQMRQLLFTGPDELRDRFQGASPLMLVRTAAAMRPRPDGDPVGYTTKRVLRDLARRVQVLDREIVGIDSELRPLVTAVAPELLAIYGVGIDTAAALLVAAGDNPERLHSEAAWAHLCGVAPIPASSGTTQRHRLNRGGNRQANAALYRIVLTRLRYDPRTHAYVERRRAEGRTISEIARCLKRYVARETYKALPHQSLH
jgi:transposase